MNPETIRDYLQRTAMDQAQAEALSRIFAEMATSNDLRMLESRGRSLEEKLDIRFHAFEGKIDARFRAFEDKIDARFCAFEDKIDTRLLAFEDKIDARMARLEADLTRKMIAGIGIFGTIITIVNALLS